MEKKNTLFKNTIYKSILSFVNIVVPIIIGPYIARLLDIELYGIYNAALADFQMFLAFASFGVYIYGVREISKYRNDKKKISQLFTNLFLISLISNIICIFIYGIFVFLTSSGIKTIIYLLLIIQFAANIIYVEFVNEAIENYRFITIKSIIVKVIYFIAILMFVRHPNDIEIYTIIISLTVFLNNLISFIYAKKQIKFDFSNIKFKKYLKPLITVLVITNVDLLFSQLDKVMLGRYVNDVAVTLYFIPYYIVSTLVSVPYAIINVSIPRLSYILKNEGKKVYEEKLNNSIASLLFIIIPMCFGIFVLAREIIILYSDVKYLDSIIPLMIICMVRIIISLESVMNNLIMYPNNKENRILKVSLTCGLLNLILNYTLVIFKIFSPTTAILTTAIAELIIFIWHYTYARNNMKLNVKVFSKQNITYLILSILFIPISIIVKFFNIGFLPSVILIMILCAIMYITVLYIIKDNNIIFILDKVKRKLRVGSKV